MIVLDFPNAVDTVERFYGRGRELTLAMTVFTEGRRVPVVVIGERRIGKTSFQNVVISQLVKPGSSQLIPLIIEPRGIQTVDQFVEAVLGRLSAEASRDLNEAGVKCRDGYIHLESPVLFENICERLLDGLPERHFILCIDEFDELIRVTGEIGEQEQNRLMGLIHHLVESSRLPLSLFLSMTRFPDAAGNQIASPLLAKSQIIELRPFDFFEMEEMLAGLLRGYASIATEEKNWLYAQSGGHPYILKLIIANIFEGYDPGPEPVLITRSILEKAMLKAVDDPRGQYAFENIYRVHFNADEKRVMLYLAERGEPVNANELRAASITLLTAAKNLQKRHYFVERDGEYSMRAQFLGEWLRNWAEFDEEIERLNVHQMVR